MKTRLLKNVIAAVLIWTASAATNASEEDYRADDWRYIEEQRRLDAIQVEQQRQFQLEQNYRQEQEYRERRRDAEREAESYWE